MKLRYWRRQLKRRYAEWDRIRDQYDCGYSLARFMSRRLLLAEDQVNEAIRMCKQLDPQCKLEEIKS